MNHHTLLRETPPQPRRRRRWAIFLTVALAGGLAAALALAARTRPSRSGQSRADATAARLRRLVFEAYPRWVVNHPAATCPSLSDLGAATVSAATADAWGHALALRCLRPDGVAAISAGPDGRLGTRDDLAAWAP